MEQRISTKQRIMNTALTLFSQKGYEAVGVEEIAKGVGIKAPSLYKHFKSKQAIFDAIMEVIEQRFETQEKRMYEKLDDGYLLYFFEDITEEELLERVRTVVEYVLKDEYISKFRKLLTQEQFYNKRLAKIYNERYIEVLPAYHEALFKKLIEEGVLIEEDVCIMAKQYVYPIYVLLGYVDREPETEEEVLHLIVRHVQQFYRLYKKDTK